MDENVDALGVVRTMVVVVVRTKEVRCTYVHTYCRVFECRMKEMGIV